MGTLTSRCHHRRVVGTTGDGENLARLTVPETRDGVNGTVIASLPAVTACESHGGVGGADRIAGRGKDLVFGESSGRRM